MSSEQSTNMAMTEYEPDTESGSESTTESNIKPQCSPALHWVFTWNNYEKWDKDWYNTLSSIDSSIVPVLVFQEEEGDENGVPHIQGALSFRSKNRPFSLNLPKSIIWILGNACDVKGNEKPPRMCKAILKKSREYACKLHTRKPGAVPYMRGFAKDVEEYIVHIENKYEWQKEIDELVASEPDERSIYWIWGDGNVGKTYYQKHLFTTGERVVILGGKASDCKNAIVDYKSKNNRIPRTILINVTRDKRRDVSYDTLETIKDMIFYSGKYEGGMVCGKNPHVIVFANNPPDTEKMSMDRWWIRKIENMKLVNENDTSEEDIMYV